MQYGLAAARLPIWFAACSSGAARELAANWWRNVLGSQARAGPIALSLTGATLNGDRSPVMLLAGAAAARAAGDETAARNLSANATALSRRAPTYYGDAWVALAPRVLDAADGPAAEESAGEHVADDLRQACRMTVWQQMPRPGEHHELRSGDLVGERAGRGGGNDAVGGSRDDHGPRRYAPKLWL